MLEGKSSFRAIHRRILFQLNQVWLFAILLEGLRAMSRQGVTLIKLIKLGKVRKLNSFSNRYTCLSPSFNREVKLLSMY
jgi:hypothetical protein